MNRPQVNMSWLVALELESNQLEGDSGWVGWLELKFDQEVQVAGTMYVVYFPSNIPSNI